MPIIVETCLFGQVTERAVALIGRMGERRGQSRAWREMPDPLDSFPVARGFRQRLWGLSRRERTEAGPGLLIPRCASVHTFGMRFELDLFFLDGSGRVVAVHRRVPPRRLVWQRGARAVLEIPAEEGGESGTAGT